MKGKFSLRIDGSERELRALADVLRPDLHRLSLVVEDKDGYLLITSSELPPGRLKAALFSSLRLVSLFGEVWRIAKGDLRET